MREQFIEKRFGPASEEIIATAELICADYRSQGFDLTLRQLYYQFVANHGLLNKDESYRRLGSIVNDARLAGRLDWSYIQDRGRNVNGGFWGYDNPTDLMDGMADRYVESIWEGQQYRPEVWVEKEALIDVIRRGCRDTRTPSFACKGYVSQSEMYAAAKRIEERRDEGTIPVIIHLGDHDPSGIDMTRDIRERLTLMSYGDVEVRRIALNMDQVREYNPPPNPAKLTDARGSRYVEEYGSQSWELDALDPTTLVALIRAELDGMIDAELMDERRASEARGEQSIRDITEHWGELTDRWDDVCELLGIDEP